MFCLCYAPCDRATSEDRVLGNFRRNVMYSKHPVHEEHVYLPWLIKAPGACDSVINDIMN